MSLATLDYAVTTVAGLACLLLYLKRSKPYSLASHLPLPPGPPRWPLIGSLLSMPDSSESNWAWFTRWANKTASDIIYFRVLGSDTIVLHSREAAVELLEHRWNIYSDRPHMIMAGDLVGWNRMLGLADYSDETKVVRKYLHNSLSVKAMSSWREQQEQEAFRFLRKLLRSPENLISHIRHTASATVVRLTYGYTPKDQDDRYVKIAEVAMDNFSLTTTPGAFMVDIFSILRYVPWAPFKRTAAEFSNQLMEFINVPMDFVHDQMETAASLYGGGADTTVSAISTFFVAMLHYPEAQKLAQKEIDQVLGKDRLPTFADRASLPYVESLYKEVMRWQPIGPIGIPHRLGSEVDDEYKGMRIPANATVIANIRHMVRNPSVYQDPETFNPSRFFGENKEPNPEDVVFGFGRRSEKLKEIIEEISL
ncbi:unnamed protein product [Rhizoctonia solani]|uniref:O-methylsterigmatocystin oxidoreductase n=1 Tax=Rhizoctonia solani TaxID=456999 RepID=A0A8H3E580_9AGAM|nr:unnamed protein product [Rhizoctonia solani]